MLKYDFKSRPLTLGIYFDGDLKNGGAYQQCLRAIELIKRTRIDNCNLKIVTSDRNSLNILHETGVPIVYLKNGPLKKTLHFFNSLCTHPRFVKLANKFGSYNPYDFFFAKHSIDLVYFVGPFNLATKIQSTNYIFTIWDFAHKEHPEFPEIRNFFEFEIRESLYQRAISRAVAVIVESEAGKARLIKNYRVDCERVYIAPLSSYSASRGISKENSGIIFEKYKIQGEYIYYPAQYWAHKNHAYILYAIRYLLETTNIIIKVVFSGADKGNLSFLRELVDELGLQDSVVFCGFVSEIELMNLYRGALAMVMPTYFGPSNLPPLEAFSLGVPVIYSKILSKEQNIESAVISIDLDDPVTLANAVIRLKNDIDLRGYLIKEGYKVINKSQELNPYDFLKDIMGSFRSKLNSWKLPKSH